MRKKSLDFFKKLLDCIGPSGYEAETAKTWAAEARTFADEVYGDQHGNVYACINKGGSPRVMLAGHIDEIGLLVTYIDEKGFLNFAQVGGWDPQILQGQRVWIQTRKGRILGVVGKKPIHKMKQAERDKVVKIDDMWIDIGAKDKKDAEKLVQVGDPAVLAYRPDELQNGLLVSRAMDDRAGAFVVLEAARLLSRMDINAEVFAVATVQEEVGLRGAATSAYALDPQVGIAVDVTFGTDFPSMSKRDGEITLGKGPVIARGPNINPCLFELFTKTAKKHKIDYQLEGAPRGTGTDANRIQLTRAGVSTGLISIPNRYMHSPCEVVSISDLENSAKLIANTVAAIGPRTDFKVKLT